MKKIIALILISVLLLSFVGCNRNSDDNNSDAFESVIFRVAWTHGGAFFENALNFEKLEGKNGKGMPIYRVDTKEELDTFKENYNDQLGIGSDDEELIAKYDDKFFKENSLLIVYKEAISGSYTFGFDRISFTNDSLCVHIVRTNDPNHRSEDMAGWLITVAVPDSLIKNCTSFDAVYDGYKGDETTSSKPESDESKKPSSEYNFTARLLEKTADSSYLMEVTDVGNGNFAIGNEVVVISDMLSHFNIGDTLNIQFDGKVTMSIPPQVVNVLGVTFINGADETENTKASSGSATSEPAKITVTRVGSGYYTSFSDDALNAEKVNYKQWNLWKNHPIFSVNTREELEVFITAHDSQLYLSTKFAKVAEQYNDDFFKENSLLLVHVQSSTGSYEFDVGSVDITKDSVCVHVIRTNDPQYITSDLAGWLITVAVPDSVVENCTTFDAVHDGYKESATTES